MIAGLLKQTGVYLGADGDFLPAQQDNPLGFWEHFGFHALNERLLLHLGAGWDMSDLPNGWASRNDLAPFRDVARQLIERMRTSAEGRTAWGWKDPRNSITIPFWKAVLPELLVVVCVRNPLDVAGSLRRRNDMSFAASGRLWLRHYQSLLCNVAAQDRVVTRYESYFDDPHGELKRILGELRLRQMTRRSPLQSAPWIRLFVITTPHSSNSSRQIAIPKSSRCMSICAAKREGRVRCGQSDRPRREPDSQFQTPRRRGIISVAGFARRLHNAKNTIDA